MLNLLFFYHFIFFLFKLKWESSFFLFFFETIANHTCLKDQQVLIWFIFFWWITSSKTKTLINPILVFGRLYYDECLSEYSEWDCGKSWECWKLVSLNETYWIVFDESNWSFESNNHRFKPRFIEDSRKLPDLVV